MEYIVTEAEPTDVDRIHEVGTSDRAFRVSDRIRFYEKSELYEWISTPRENILLVVRSGSSLAGFLYCKIMSSHWAMLDNFYVRPAYRDGQCASVLFEALRTRLIERGTTYLSTLVDRKKPSLSRYLQKGGFRRVGEYEWHEIFLRKCFKSHSTLG